MRLKHLITATLVLQFAVSLLAETNEIYYQKALSTNETALLYRKELSRSEVINADSEHLQKVREHKPEARLVPVQQVFEFTLFYRAEKQAEKMVWSKRFNYRDRGPAIPSDFKFLDICKREQDLYLLYKEGAETYVQKIASIEANPPKAEASVKLLMDSPAFGRIATQGSFARNERENASLKITYANGKNEAWSLVGTQWESETNPPAK